MFTNRCQPCDPARRQSGYTHCSPSLSDPLPSLTHPPSAIILCRLCTGSHTHTRTHACTLVIPNLTFGTSRFGHSFPASHRDFLHWSSILDLLYRIFVFLFPWVRTKDPSFDFFSPIPHSPVSRICFHHLPHFFIFLASSCKTPLTTHRNDPLTSVSISLSHLIPLSHLYIPPTSSS